MNPVRVICLGIAMLLCCSMQHLAQSLDIDASELERAGASWSYCIRDLQSGEVLYQKEADRLMTPASNLKIITSGLAIEILGADFRYKTEIGLSGHRAEEGSWNGDIVILADGDPSLGSEHWSERAGGREVFEPVIDTLKGRGIHKINGDLIIMTGSYDRRAHHPTWHWSDLANYFGINAGALNYHDNSYTIYLDRSYQTGDSVGVIRTEPKVPYKFDTRLTVGPPGSGDEAWIYGAPWDDYRLIRGTVPPGNEAFKIKGSVGQPEQWFGQLLQSALKNSGIKLSGRIRLVGNEFEGRFHPLHTWNSPPLSELVEVTNRKSSNLMAEALLKTLGSESGHAATTESGIKAMEQRLEVHGLKNGYYLVDGSGLSADNALSCAFVTEYLCLLFGNNPNRNAIEQFLPRAGAEGTVSYLNTDRGTVWLKSGSLSQAKGYSGIVRNSEGKFLAISVMVNHFGKEVGRASQFCSQVIQEAIVATKR